MKRAKTRSVPRATPRTLTGALPILLAGAFGLAAGCAAPGIPDVPPPPAPYERYPYVQAVSDSSASVLWTTRTLTQDTVRYWVDGSGDTARIGDPEPRRWHRVDLGSLGPDTRVGYRVHSSTGASSGVHFFRTAPRPGAKETVDVLVFGDSGWGSEGQVELAEEMLRHEFGLALHTGDIAYDHGSYRDLTERHFRVYRSLLARVPLFPVLGNHDVRTEGGKFVDRAFVLPAAAEREGRRYYSFRWGRVHIVALDSNEATGAQAELREAGPQYRWLTCDLATASKDETIDWIIVYMHHPIYSSAAGVSAHGSDRELRDALAPLFDRYRVDLVLAGHDHAYERTWPLRGGEVDSTTPGTVYVVTGGGGADFSYRRVGHRWYTAASASTYHFVKLEISSSRISARAIGRTGALIDAFVIERSSEGSGRRCPEGRSRCSFGPTPASCTGGASPH